jgi:signal transduction histidine kinase
VGKEVFLARGLIFSGNRVKNVLSFQGESLFSAYKAKEKFMNLSAAQKLGFGLLGVLLLGFLISGLAYLSTSLSAERFEDLIALNLEHSRLINELRISLLEQGGLTASYLLDGSPRWLEELSRRRPYFETCLERVSRGAVAPEQQHYIDKISAGFQKYDAARTEAIQLYDEGRGEQARQVLLEKVSREYREVYSLCEELFAANEADIEAAANARKVQMKQLRMWTLIGLTTLIALIAGLFWMMMRGVFAPLHRIVRNARQYAEQAQMILPQAEMEVVETYLDKLRTDINDARNRLARSNRHLLDAEQMASIGRIAAGVAHEIRSPLTSLRLRSFSMKKALGDRFADDCEVMMEEVLRLDNIIRNFLEFSRPPELRLQPCNILLVLDKTLELLRYKLDLQNIEIDMDKPSSLPPVMADSHQLRQVFLNLLNNAIDVLPGGGRIRIQAARESKTSRPSVVITLKDSGPGMPARTMERIFDPFFSTKEDGAGLGLWIAQRIMAQHGGALELVSSTEHGTRFAVTIPVAVEVVDEHHTGR